jgi:dipeptidyl-peptidase III
MSATFLASSPDKRKLPVNLKEFKWQTEQFGDCRILRYVVPGFDNLPLRQKQFIYYLSQAAIAGRDITYDQNCKYNLLVRKTLECVYLTYKGEKKGNNYNNFLQYLKKVWFNNGIHHHYSTDKMTPDFPKEYLGVLIKGSELLNLPLSKGESVDEFIAEMTKILYDPTVVPKRVCQDPALDLVKSSGSNFYESVNQKEAEAFYEKMKSDARRMKKDTLISFGLNSKLVKENGRVVEKVYKVDGLYTKAIEKIVYFLTKAKDYADNPDQAKALKKLIEFYKTGSLTAWDEYNILWVQDLASQTDYVNGFIEVYGDPLAKKGTWEAMVNFKNVEATKRTETISQNAQYFEDNSPVDPRFKKKVVKGVSAKVITVAQLGGESDPTTPIGINLPNAQWIRKEYGSKSVTLDNITYAYDQSAVGNGFIEEFAYSKEEVDNNKNYGYLAGTLTTDLHECLGHGSGQMLEGVTGESLKNYHSTIEEARADLFALYYIMDQKLIDLQLIPTLDVAKTEYNNYIRNGLMTQLVRISPGKNVEEAHMRDRSLIAHWVYENGKEKNVIEQVTKGGKTYFKINDYTELKSLFGKLLAEIQRITSEGDYKAAGDLVEKYAVNVDPELHKEVLKRYKKLNIAPYAGFINPQFTLEMRGDSLKDISISYPMDFTAQMLYYSKTYSTLPARTTK